MTKRILAIDTSGQFLSVAILQGERLLAGFHSQVGHRHSELLVPTIEKLIAKAKIKLKKLDGFAVSIGPGSFTGLRIAVATVKGLSIATGKPVVCVHTLEAIAGNAAGDSAYFVCSLMDARRDNVYGALYASQKNLKPLLKCDVVNAEEFIEKVKKTAAKKPDAKILFLGDGLMLYKEKIAKKIGKRACFSLEKLWYPRAKIIGRLGQMLLARGRTTTLRNFKPLYLYPDTAQCRKT